MAATNFLGIQPLLVVTRKCSSAVTQYYVVKDSSTDGYCEMTASQGEKALGVALDAGSANDYIRVLVLGIAPVVVTTASGLAKGDSITPSATTDNGKVEEAASGDYIMGKAIDAPSADDDQVMAFIDCVKYGAALA